MGEWISVIDRLPALGERVLLCVGGTFVGEGWWRENQTWMRYDDLLPIEEIFHKPVTHWMPHPAPPGGDGA